MRKQIFYICRLQKSVFYNYIIFPKICFTPIDKSNNPTQKKNHLYNYIIITICHNIFWFNISSIDEKYYTSIFIFRHATAFDREGSKSFMDYRKMRDRFASRLTLVPFRELLSSWVSVVSGENTHIVVGASINQKWLTTESKPFRTRPTDDSNSKDPQCHTGFDRTVNIVQFSVIGPGVKRSHVVAVVRLPCNPRATLRFCFHSRRCSTNRQQFRFFYL